MDQLAEAAAAAAEHLDNDEEFSFLQENDEQSSETSFMQRTKPCTWVELLTQAIETSPGQRLTLPKIYDWMIDNGIVPESQRNAPFSATWKNSIRSRLSKFKRFARVPNQNNAKVYQWTVDVSQNMKRNEIREPWKGIRKKKIQNVGDEMSSNLTSQVDAVNEVPKLKLGKRIRKKSGQFVKDSSHANDRQICKSQRSSKRNRSATDINCDYDNERNANESAIDEDYFTFHELAKTSDSTSAIVKLEQPIDDNYVAFETCSSEGSADASFVNSFEQSIERSPNSKSPTYPVLANDWSLKTDVEANRVNNNRLLKKVIAEVVTSPPCKCKCKMTNEEYQEFNEENDLLARLTRHTFEKLHPALRAKGKLRLQQLLCDLEERSFELYSKEENSLQQRHHRDTLQQD